MSVPAYALPTAPCSQLLSRLPSPTPSPFLACTCTCRTVLLLHLQDRVSRLRQFIRSRSEKLVVVVGHACLFKSLAKQSTHMKNCEMYHTSL